MRTRSLRIVIAIAALAFVIKCAMAFLTYGTNDVTTWQYDLAKLSTQGAAALYRDGIQFPYKGRPSPVQVFSHPPAMIHVLRFWGFLGRVTGLPIQFWMRLSCAVADAGSLFVVWKIARLPSLRISPASLMLLAGSPVSILISGFHGNTDPIMIFFVLVSVYCVEIAAPALAGLFFGLALCVKIVPLIFGMVFILCLPSLQSRLRFLLVAAGVFVVAGLPYMATDPILIIRALATYSGLPGVWGILLAFAGVSAAVQKAGFILLVVAASVAMNVPRPRLPLFAQAGAIATLFLVFAPGFAVQYLAWNVTWIVYLGAWETLTYFAVAGAFITAAYLHWLTGAPGYEADAMGLGPVGLILLLACWWVSGTMLLLYIKRSRVTV